MRLLRLLAVLLPVVGLLAACTVQVRFPVNPVVVWATNPAGGSSAVASFPLSAAGVSYYQIDVSAAQRSNYAVLQVELDRNLNLTLYGPGGTVYASSSSPAYFATATLGLSSLSGVAGQPAPQGINTTRSCAGSCIIEPLSSATDHYYLRVENQTSAAATVQLYAFVRGYDDSGEPGNNTLGGATPLAPGASGDSGAIEVLGDVDYWSMSAAGTLSFDSSSAVRARADIIDRTSQTVLKTLQPGGTYAVAAGDWVKVYALDNARAGVAASSSYFLTLQ